jgi:glutaredoxin
MKIFLLLIALGAAYWQWHKGALPFTEKPAALDAAGKPAVWVFTFNDCGAACKDAVQELKNRHAPFEEKRVNPDDLNDANGQLWQRYKNGDQFPILVAGANSTGGFYTPSLATLLGNTFGTTYLTADEKRFFKKHFNADGSARIVMYGTDWCPYCAALKKDFNANNTDYLEIDVEKSGEQNLLSSVMGINGYPATWVGYTRVFHGEKYAEVMDVLADALNKNN